MEADRRQQSVLRNLDWWTVLIYIALLSFGWISVCGASYSYGETDIFSLSTRSGMQIVWIATSIMLGTIVLLLDDRIYDTFSYVIYALLLLQPAEFAKFATALALAKLMSTYGYSIQQWRHFGATLLVILLPMLCIVLQRETGSALVYLSFFLMFYREGMPGSILFTGIAMVVYFVVGIRFAEVPMGSSSTMVGPYAVMVLIQLFSIGMVWVYCHRKLAWRMLLCSVGVTLLSLPLLSFGINIVYIQMAQVVFLIGYLLFQALSSRIRNYFFIALFALGLTSAHVSTCCWVLTKTCVVRDIMFTSRRLPLALVACKVRVS